MTAWLLLLLSLLARPAVAAAAGEHPSSSPVQITNDSDRPVEIHWIHPQTGETVLQADDVAHGTSFSLNSFVGHSFQVRERPDAGEGGQCGGEDRTCRVEQFTVNDNEDQGESWRRRRGGEGQCRPDGRVRRAAGRRCGKGAGTWTSFCRRARGRGGGRVERGSGQTTGRLGGGRCQRERGLGRAAGDVRAARPREEAEAGTAVAKKLRDGRAGRRLRRRGSPDGRGDSRRGRRLGVACGARPRGISVRARSRGREEGEEGLSRVIALP